MTDRDCQAALGCLGAANPHHRRATRPSRSIIDRNAHSQPVSDSRCLYLRGTGRRGGGGGVEGGYSEAGGARAGSGADAGCGAGHSAVSGGGVQRARCALPGVPSFASRMVVPTEGGRRQWLCASQQHQSGQRGVAAVAAILAAAPVRWWRCGRCHRGAAIRGGEGGGGEGRGGKAGAAWLLAKSGITCRRRVNQRCVSRGQQGAQRAGRQLKRRHEDAWASPRAGGNR